MPGAPGYPHKGFAPGMPPISGYVSIDRTNVTQLKAAVWLFGNVLFGVDLLQSSLS